MTEQKPAQARNMIDTRKFEELPQNEQIERLREECRDLRRALSSVSRVAWEVRSLMGMHRHGDDGVVLYPQHAIDRGTIGGGAEASALDRLA